MLDLAKLSAVQLAGLLNRYRAMGTADIGVEVLRRHMRAARYQVGDGRRFHLLKYAAWLRRQLLDRPSPSAASGPGDRPSPLPAISADPYEAIKERARRRSETLSKSGRDIGELPAVADPPLKDRCRQNLDQFCRAHLAETFCLPFSSDQRQVIASLQEAALGGGLFAYAMPRGSGKTSLAEAAVMWAALYGHQVFCLLIGAEEGHAQEMLDSIKTELSTNEQLLANFPETLYPIHCLEAIAQRARGQLYRGTPTRIRWDTRRIVLPSIPDSPAAGVVIQAAGLTARLRGLKVKRHDGRSARPTFVVIDDPQTDESARSPSQCFARETLLSGAVLNLAGPGQKIAAVMPCTVIQPGDLADRMLDRKAHPEWHGTRLKMLYRFPERMDLWAEYARLRGEDLAAGGAGARATAFYAAHRAAMDKGAEVAWPARHNADELSGLQHAMNFFYRDRRAFLAEAQSEPLPIDDAPQEELTAAAIAAKLNGLAPGVCPLDATVLTAMIDCHAQLLYYVVAAWSSDFTGALIAYGTWPDQPLPYFAAADAPNTLSRACPNTAIEGQLAAGLEALVGRLMSHEWPREGGGPPLRLDLCLIDANWLHDPIDTYCRRSPHAARLLPAHGKFVGAATTPFAEWKRRPGEQVGFHWRIHGSQQRAVRYALTDVNFWKSFIYARLAVSPADRGSLSLFGRDPNDHRLLADHVTSEYRVRTTAKGKTGDREVDEWKQRVGRDNHLLDCLVGAAAAASIRGCSLFGAPAPRRRRGRVSYL